MLGEFIKLLAQRRGVYYLSQQQKPEQMDFASVPKNQVGQGGTERWTAPARGQHCREVMETRPCGGHSTGHVQAFTVSLGCGQIHSLL